MKKLKPFLLFIFLYHLSFLFSLLIISFFDVKIPLHLKKVIAVYVLLPLTLLVFHSSAKKILLNSTLLSFSMLFTLVLSNWVLHYTFMEQLYYRPHDRFNQVSHEKPVQLHHYQPKVYYEGEAYGDLAAQSRQLEGKETKFMEFITDELGFRNRPQQKDKNNSLLLIGDSFGVGTGTTQDSTMSSFLAQATRQNLYNFSYPAMPFLELTRLALDLQQVKKDTAATLIWLIFSGNDLEACPANYSFILKEIENKTIPTLFKAGLLQKIQLRLANYYRKSPIRGLFVRSFSKKIPPQQTVFIQKLNEKDNIYFQQEYIKTAQLSKAAIVAHPSFTCFKKSLQSGKIFAEQQGLKLKLVYIPCKYEVYQSFAEGKQTWSPPSYPAGFSAAMQELANELGFDFLDTTPSLIEKAEQLFQEKGRILWWRDDTHLNVAGNRVLSEVIQAHFLKD